MLNLKMTNGLGVSAHSQKLGLKKWKGNNSYQNTGNTVFHGKGRTTIKVYCDTRFWCGVTLFLEKKKCSTVNLEV
jgi:hypothetical protein